MTALDCRALHEVIEALADGQRATAAEQGHLDLCADCRARLALARRVERLLLEWPVAAPAPGFSARVGEMARREAWRAEQVVDWGFNIAIAAGLGAVAVGVASAAWLAGSAAAPADARVVLDAAGDLVERLRGHATVAATGTLLLTTTLGAWWWAEERRRW